MRLCRIQRSERSAKPHSLPPAHSAPPGPHRAPPAPHSAPSAAEAAGAVDGRSPALPPPPSPVPRPSPSSLAVAPSFSRPRLLLLDVRRVVSLDSIVAGSASVHSPSSPEGLMEQAGARQLSPFTPGSPPVSVSTAFPEGCKEDRSSSIEICVEARVSPEWRSGSGRVGALLGLRGFLALPPPASGLWKLELLQGGGGSEGLLLALPPASELRELELRCGGSGSEGFLVLLLPESELWELKLLGEDAAIFRPQWHCDDTRLAGDRSMTVIAAATAAAALTTVIACLPRVRLACLGDHPY